jgi:hypothetical protein
MDVTLQQWSIYLKEMANRVMFYKYAENDFSIPYDVEWKENEAHGQLF